ncbi:hypothetical protein CYLTODRAFT_457960 [Cylindrobasidium torrendii FP15055 ss-10]|uniref:F-box domain-containing protein n=1 Tax=Cylindrobasidium torrendii FP15055 ss-10 TaxID=1314674 RepID=A0A0D7AZD9_9AGAR|nr:hypothetical protein CYLTODRAFT_457960 [Cylindrobasidium torrendii FP15055 ss-10]
MQLDDSTKPSLILTFPDELLIEIFDHFLQISQQGSFGYPSAFTDTHPGGPRLVVSGQHPNTKVFESHNEILGPQVVLISVCRRWTAVARSEPRLWRLVPLFGPAVSIPRFEPGVYPRERSKVWIDYYDIGFYYKTPRKNAQQQAEHWRMFDDRVSLAKAYPLHLHLFLGIEHNGENATGQIFSRLRRLIDRTSVLVITCRDLLSGIYPLWQDLPFAEPFSRPLLLNTVIFSQFCPPETIQDWLFLTLTRSPRPPFSTARVLSHAFLQELSAEDILTLLSNSQGLVSLKTEENVFPYMGSETEDDAVTHTQLQELCLGGEGWETLVPYLTLPALVHLDIGESDGWPRHEDIEFFERSCCHLKTFIARRVEYMNPEFADFLRLTPSLEHYRFPMPSGWDDCPTPYEVLDTLSESPPPRLVPGDLHVVETDLYRVQAALNGVLEGEAYFDRQQQLDVTPWSWGIYIYTSNMEDSSISGDGQRPPELQELHHAFSEHGIELKIWFRPRIEEY